LITGQPPTLQVRLDTFARWTSAIRLSPSRRCGCSVRATLMSVAVQGDTAAGVPPPTGAGDVTIGASLALGVTPVGVDVTGDVSDVELAVVGVTGHEPPQAWTPARIMGRPHRAMTVLALSSALLSFPYKTAAVAAS
jgi:hypothetical protein